jgi:hypothetical protein
MDTSHCVSDDGQEYTQPQRQCSVCGCVWYGDPPPKPLPIRIPVAGTNLCVETRPLPSNGSVGGYIPGIGYGALATASGCSGPSIEDQVRIVKLDAEAKILLVNAEINTIKAQHEDLKQKHDRLLDAHERLLA